MNPNVRWDLTVSAATQPANKLPALLFSTIQQTHTLSPCSALILSSYEEITQFLSD